MNETNEMWRTIKAEQREERARRARANTERAYDLKKAGVITTAWFAPTVVRISRADRPNVRVDFWPSTERWMGPKMRRAKQGWESMLAFLGIPATEAPHGDA